MRRALSTRNARWARVLASRLAHAGVRPNAVSIAGLVFAASACAAFVVVPNLSGRSRGVALIVVAVSIQLRLLCNLLDGMLAVEQGLKTATGDIYNDLPDRIADVVILAGAGYSLRDAAFGPAIGWLAATLAVFTAYVRLLGGSLGVTQQFIGPMAKQHRMFALTVAAAAGAIETVYGRTPRAVLFGLITIVAGAVVTVIRRTRRILLEVASR